MATLATLNEKVWFRALKVSFLVASFLFLIYSVIIAHLFASMPGETFEDYVGRKMKHIYPGLSVVPNDVITRRFQKSCIEGKVTEGCDYFNKLVGDDPLGLSWEAKLPFVERSGIYILGLVIPFVVSWLVARTGIYILTGKF